MTTRADVSLTSPAPLSASLPSQSPAMGSGASARGGPQFPSSTPLPLEFGVTRSVVGVDVAERPPTVSPTLMARRTPTSIHQYHMHPQPTALPILSNLTPLQHPAHPTLPNMSFIGLHPDATSAVKVPPDGSIGTEDITYLAARSRLGCTWDLVYNGAPVCVTVAMWYLIQTLASAAVGNYLGANDLAAASIAYYAFCFISLYPGMGMTYAVDTINSQAYGADPMSTVQGETCQRSLFVNCILLVPMTVLLFSTEPFFAWLYNPDFGARVATWHQYSIVYLGAQMHYCTLSKFVNNQLKQHLATASLIVAAVTVFPLSVLFVDRLKLGIAGAPLAMGVASTLQLVALLLLIRRDKDAWARFGPLLSLSELMKKEDMKTFLRLGIPSVVFVAGEAGAFDFVVLYAGTLGDVEAAAWSTVQSTMLISQSTSCAMSVAASTLIGQAVGAGMKDLAKRYATIAPVIAAALASIASLLVIVNHRAIFSLMTPDEAVQQKIETLLWVIPIYHVLDCVQYVFQGVFSGCGMNHKGSKVLLSTLWGVGFPLTVVGAMHGLPWEVAGFSTGMAVEVPLFVWVIVRQFDWEPYE